MTWQRSPGHHGPLVRPKPLDLSLTTYVDDIAKTLVLEEHTAQAARDTLHTCSDFLTEELAEHNFAQNIKKQVVLPSIRNHYENKAFFKTPAQQEYKVEAHGRYFGHSAQHLVVQQARAPTKTCGSKDGMEADGHMLVLQAPLTHKAVALHISCSTGAAYRCGISCSTSWRIQALGSGPARQT